MTDFLVRAAKTRMASQCSACGRSDASGALPASFTPAFDAFLTESTDKWPQVPILLRTAHPAGDVVYSGLLKVDNKWRDRRGFVVLKIETTPFNYTLIAPIPRGLIVGWSFDQDGEYYRLLTQQGCGDGNEFVRRQAAAHMGAR